MSFWTSVWGHIDTWASSAWAAAVAGRLAWHTRLVQKGERRLISAELAFEIPIVVLTYLIGVGIAAYFKFEGPVAGAVVSVVAYMGPGTLQVIAQRYVESKSP